MADKVIGFKGVPAARRHLARQLREMADIISADMAETEPHGILMCLMGATQFEVIAVGQAEGWIGARQAMSAVLMARFDTVGGNIRQRVHQMYQPRDAAEILPLVVSQKPRNTENE